MDILLATAVPDALSRRLQVELTDAGHSVEPWSGPTAAPDLVIELAPATSLPVPASTPSLHVWATCDRVEVAEGDTVWASQPVDSPSRAMRPLLARVEVVDAAAGAVLEAVRRVSSGSLPQAARRTPHPDFELAVDWHRDGTDQIAYKIRSAEARDGASATVLGHDVKLFGAHEEDALRGAHGRVLAQRDEAICIGTTDGAIWVTHVAPADAPTGSQRLPAAHVLSAQLQGVPHLDLPIAATLHDRTFREIRYRERDGVGYLSFDFYRGVPRASQCQRLRAAYQYARSRPTRVLCLLGGSDVFCSGLDYAVIAAAKHPTLERKQNALAFAELVRDVLETRDKLVITALRGDAVGGGLELALAADLVYIRPGVVLQPASHEPTRGIEARLLEQRLGPTMATILMKAAQPISSRIAERIGLVDEAFGTAASFRSDTVRRARELAWRSDVVEPSVEPLAA